jgi:hypothetical protein
MAGCFPFFISFPAFGLPFCFDPSRLFPQASKRGAPECMHLFCLAVRPVERLYTRDGRIAVGGEEG